MGTKTSTRIARIDTDLTATLTRLKNHCRAKDKSVASPDSLPSGKVDMKDYVLKDKPELASENSLGNKKGAAKAPCGSHRVHLAAEAARLFPTCHGRSTGFDPRGECK